MLADLLPAGIFAVLLVFVRVGASLSLLPAFGEAYVTPRLRLVVALVIALLLAPVLAEQLPPMPTQPAALLLLILGEALVGIFLGTLARMFMSALTTAGMVIAYSSSLANALVDDPSAAQQGSIAGTFLTMVALLMIIFPISKLMHAPGVFFSPTRNQTDDSRERRHIAPWAKELEASER